MYVLTSQNDKKKVNKKKKIESPEIKADEDAFAQMLKTLSKLTKIEPPDVFEDHESCYASRLCVAYSEDAVKVLYKRRSSRYEI